MVEKAMEIEASCEGTNICLACFPGLDPNQHEFEET